MKTSKKVVKKAPKAFDIKVFVEELGKSRAICTGARADIAQAYRLASGEDPYATAIAGSKWLIEDDVYQLRRFDFMENGRVVASFGLLEVGEGNYWGHLSKDIDSIRALLREDRATEVPD